MGGGWEEGGCMTYMCKLKKQGVCGQRVCVLYRSHVLGLCVAITSADGVRLFTEGHR